MIDVRRTTGTVPVNFIDSAGESARYIGGPASCSITVTGSGSVQDRLQARVFPIQIQRPGYGPGSANGSEVPKGSNTEQSDGGMNVALTILGAERGAGDRLFNSDCAGLFLAPDQ